jgi:hypothetical protein
METAEGYIQGLILDFLKDKDLDYFLGNSVATAGGSKYGGSLHITRSIDAMVEDPNHPIRKEISDNTGLEVYNVVAKDPAFASEEVKKAFDAQTTSQIQRDVARENLRARGIKEHTDEWIAEWPRAVDDVKENMDEIERIIYDVRGDNGGVNKTLFMNNSSANKKGGGK